MAYLGHKPAVGENNSFRILDDISSFVLTFDGSSASVVSLSDETITVTENNHRFITGQRVTYSNGGGGNITGLTNGQAYFVINHSKTQIKLASSASNALAGTAVNLTGLGTGSSHTLTLAFDGVNTKFDPTFGDGMHDTLIKRAAQLVISINGVIQQPHDTATPSTGFGVDALGNIIFSTPPASTDIFWGHILATNTVTFDSSDNDVDTFTGNGSTTSFTLSKTPPDNRNILVTIDGVVQYPSDAANTRSYSVSENVMTFVAAPGNGTVIQVRHIGYAGVSAGGGGGVTGFYGRTGNVSLVSTDNIVANNATFSGNVSIAQTLTYEDVTNMDVVGVATFNSDVFITDSIRHIGDTDSKIRFPDQGEFSFETNGYERFKFTETDATLLNYQGNHKVGIGTDVLVAKLDVKNNFNGPVLKLNDSHMNKYMTIRGGGTPNRMIIDSYEGGGGGAAIDFASNGSTKLRITSDGNITFGSQTGSAVAVTSSAIKNLNLGSDYWNGTKGDYRAIREHIFYINPNDLYGFGISLNMLEIQSQQDIGFFAGTSGGGTGRREERLRITSAGKFLVGIHTSSEAYTWQPRARFAVESAGDASSIHLGLRTGGSADPAIMMLRRGGSTAWHHHVGRIYTDYYPKMYFQTAFAGAPGSENFQTHMVMAHNIGVGIGTVSPTGLLDINSASGTYDHLRMRRTASGSGNSDWSLKPYAGNLYFRTAGANDHIVFTSDAKVGINTTSPTDVLDINSSQASAVSDVYIRNHADLGGAALNIWTQGTYAAPTYKAIIGCSDAGGTIRMGSASNHDLLLLTNNTPKITIKASTDLVGIGTDNPQDTLDITRHANHGIIIRRPDGLSNPGQISLRCFSHGVAEFRSDRHMNLHFDDINGNNQFFRIYSDDTQVFTIASAGRVNVGSAVTGDPWGKTGDVETGVVLQSTTTSYGIAANSKDIVGIFNRTNSGGAILEYKYNGSVVGETITNTTDLELKSTADLRLTATGGEVIVTGKLGVGLSDPTHSIEAKGSDSSIAVHYTGHSRGGLCALTNQRLAFASTHVNDDLVFGYSNSPLSTANFVERMRIDNGTATVTIKNYTTDDAQAPYLLFHNRGNDTTDNSNVYNMGGIAAAGYRDVSNPSIVAAIQFERQITASGLSSGGNIVFRTGFNGTTSHTQISKQVIIDYSGNLYPADDDDVNLGLSSKRWKNLYTADAHFSNIGTGGNEVDGTEGSWTLQEAEDTIYMINRKNGKRYKIKMEEV